MNTNLTIFDLILIKCPSFFKDIFKSFAKKTMNSSNKTKQKSRIKTTYEYKILEEVLKTLNEVKYREMKKHMMDQQLLPAHAEELDEAIDLIEGIVNYDPTPNTPYDFFH